MNQIIFSKIANKKLNVVCLWYGKECNSYRETPDFLKEYILIWQSSSCYLYSQNRKKKCRLHDRIVEQMYPKQYYE